MELKKVLYHFVFAILIIYPSLSYAAGEEFFITPISSGEQGLGDMVMEAMVTPAEEFIRRIKKDSSDSDKMIRSLERIGHNIYYALAEMHEGEKGDPVIYNESIAKAKVLLERALSVRKSQGKDDVVGYFPNSAALIRTLDELSHLKEKPVSQLQANNHFALIAYASLSRACETFIAAHPGEFPRDIEDLMKEKYPFLQTPYCSSAPQSGFFVACDFRKEGYKIAITPVKQGETGSQTLTIEKGVK